MAISLHQGLCWSALCAEGFRVSHQIRDSRIKLGELQENPSDAALFIPVQANSSLTHP